MHYKKFATGGHIVSPPDTVYFFDPPRTCTYQYHCYCSKQLVTTDEIMWTWNNLIRMETMVMRWLRAKKMTKKQYLWYKVKWTISIRFNTTAGNHSPTHNVLMAIFLIKPEVTEHLKGNVWRICGAVFLQVDLPANPLTTMTLYRCVLWVTQTVNQSLQWSTVWAVHVWRVDQFSEIFSTVTYITTHTKIPSQDTSTTIRTAILSLPQLTVAAFSLEFTQKIANIAT